MILSNEGCKANYKYLFFWMPVNLSGLKLFVLRRDC